MAKEQVLFVNFDVQPVYHDRILNPADAHEIMDDKDGAKITLFEHKKKYPYKLDNEIICAINTSERLFYIVIPAGYCWNGADIPSFLWTFVGSKDSPEFKIPSMVHDYILEFKEDICKNILHSTMNIKDYRRLTSLIFRYLLKEYGTGTIKSNIMSWAVQTFQTFCNRKGWQINDL